ncbi:phage portal protein family protein [Pseudarthrobacter polychromogenes]|uniref:Portal protein n=1 Tax=Pseudarthrobacter polychromogenes TaxID=1676 RepID=A0ABQ1Y384_9MICC|nr:hypothetical protein [Pseudarthrobacter polychromogenes]GGH10373.1 hypothetical protein GCM10011577_39160 [Pseudarthrobacter polychromogenes]
MTVPVQEQGYANGATAWWTEIGNEETPELQWPKNIDVYDRMRRQDAQVISVIRAVTLPIRRTKWRIDPNGARPEVARQVADDLGLPLVGDENEPVIRTRDRFSWSEHLRLSLLMLPFGHSIFEQVYRIDEAGMARLRKLAWRPPKTISRIDVASDGGLVAIHQHGNEKPMGVERLAVYVNEREGGNWLGQSLLRPAYKYWLLKDRMLRVQAQTNDRNGMGIPVYTASELPESVTGEDRTKREADEVAAGLKLAKGLRSGDNSGASIPNGAELDVKGVTGTLPDADKPIRYYDEQIARAVLAHFLNLGTETGSWALGSTFADFFTLSLQTVAMQIADTTTQHVIEDLVDINWGPSEPAPRLVFEEIGSRHPATAEAIRALVDCGAIKPDQKLDDHLRTVYGLPAADPATAREPLPRTTPATEMK